MRGALSLLLNALRDASGVAIADALGAPPPHGNRSLDCLDLGGNRLGPKSVLALGDALVANSALTSVELRRNKRLDAGALNAIAHLVSQNRCGRYVDPLADGGRPPELVAPNESARHLTSGRMQALFTDALRPEALRADAAAAGGGVTAGAFAADDAAREQARRTGALAELRDAQWQLREAGRHVASLRQKEAALEGALRAASLTSERSSVERQVRQ